VNIWTEVTTYFEIELPVRIDSNTVHRYCKQRQGDAALMQCCEVALEPCDLLEQCYITCYTLLCDTLLLGGLSRGVLLQKWPRPSTCYTPPRPPCPQHISVSLCHLHHEFPITMHHAFLAYVINHMRGPNATFVAAFFFWQVLILGELCWGLLT
jgi:hypothetical protein